MSAKGYWAFLSYSHADRALARWFHRALETYAVPRRLVGKTTGRGPAPRRFSPIFRDQEDLAADADLMNRVVAALDASAYLIVLCSPAAARSPWVDQEIVRFKMLSGEDRVLAVIVASEPWSSERPGQEDQECFPIALRVRVTGQGELTDDRAEPLAADLRPGGDGRRLGRLKLLARMLEVDLDELVRRDAQRRQAQLIGFSALSATVALAMGALAITAMIARDQAVASSREAQVQRGQAEGLVEFMIGDLNRRLDQKVRLEVLGAIANRAMAYYTIEAGRGLDDDALGRRARVLGMLGEIQHDLGHLDAQEELMRQAASTTGQLLARDPNNPRRIFDQGRAVDGLGERALDRSELPAAESLMAEYLRLAERLVAVGGRKPDWLSELASAHVNLGAVLLKEHKVDAAVPQMRAAMETLDALAAMAPGDLDRSLDLGQGLAWLADAERSAGDETGAAREREAEGRVYLKVLAERPTNMMVLDALIVNRCKQAQLRLDQGQVPAAWAEARRASGDVDRLLAADPHNALYRADAVGAYLALGDTALARRDFAAAAAAGAPAMALVGDLVRKDPSMVEWSGMDLGAARLLLIRAAAGAAHDRATCIRALQPVAAESERLEVLAAAHPRSDGLARLSARSQIVRGDLAAARRDLAGARRDWTLAIATVRRPAGASETRMDRPSRGLIEEASARLAPGGGTPGSCLAL